MDDRYLTPQAVADALNVSLSTVYKRLQSGDIPGFKIGNTWRIRPTALERYIEDQEGRRIHEGRQGPESRPPSSTQPRATEQPRESVRPESTSVRAKLKDLHEALLEYRSYRWFAASARFTYRIVATLAAIAIFVILMFSPVGIFELRDPETSPAPAGERQSSTLVESDVDIALADLIPSEDIVGEGFLASIYTRDSLEPITDSDTVSGPGFQSALMATYTYDDPRSLTSPLNPLAFSAECHEYDSANHASNWIAIRVAEVTERRPAFDAHLVTEVFEQIGDESVAVGGIWDSADTGSMQIGLFWFRVGEFACEYAAVDPNHLPLPPSAVAESIVALLPES